MKKITVTALEFFLPFTWLNKLKDDYAYFFNPFNIYFWFIVVILIVYIGCIQLWRTKYKV